MPRHDVDEVSKHVLHICWISIPCASCVREIGSTFHTHTDTETADSIFSPFAGNPPHTQTHTHANLGYISVLTVSAVMAHVMWLILSLD